MASTARPAVCERFPGERLGTVSATPLNKLPGKLATIASPVRKALRSQFHTLWYRARQRKGLRVLRWASGYAVLRLITPGLVTAIADGCSDRYSWLLF